MMKLLGLCGVGLFGLMGGVEAALLAENYYERIGVKKEATEREIRSAYKKLAKEVHPDKNPGDSSAHQKMVELTDALTVLTDPDLRKAYDAGGVEGVKNAKVKGTQAKQGGGRGGKKNPDSLKGVLNSQMYVDDPQITELDYHSWEASHSSSEAWFVTFYEPHCEECEKFADDWRRLGSRFQGIYHVGAVNCQKDFPVCRSLGIPSLPTTLLFPAGTPRNKQQPIRVTDHSYDYLEALARQHLPTSEHTLLPEHFPPNGDGSLPRVPVMTASNHDSTNNLWLIGYCSSATSCETTTTHLREAALAVKGLVGVGQVNCEAYSDLCAKLAQNPATSPEGAHYIATYSTGQTERFAQGNNVREMGGKLLAHLPPLPQIAMEQLEGVCQNMLAHKHISMTQDNPKEYLLLLIDQRECMGGVGGSEESGGSSSYRYKCGEALLSLRQVSNALKADWEYSELSIATFDCGNFRDGSEDPRRKTLCKELNVEQEPTIVLVKEGALGPSEFHDQVNQPNQVLAFVQMAFKSAVHEISAEDLTKHVEQEKQTWFVDFYAPWCHHCRDVWPEWNLASRHYDLPKNVKVNFGKINCEDHHDDCQKHHIRGYPTFLLFHEGVRHQFDFDFRTAEEFVRFVKETLEPVEFEFTPELYTSMISDPNHKAQKLAPPTGDGDEQRWVVDFFAPWCSHCHVMSPKFREAAKVLRGVVRFGKLNCELDSNYCMQLGIRAYPTIWRFDAGQPRTQPTAQYPGLPDPKLILNFAIAGVPDYVSVATPKDLKTVISSLDEHQSVIVLYVSSKNCDGCEEAELKLKAFASRYKTKEEKQLQAVQRADPVKETKMVTLKFHKINCRENGSAFTFCISQKVKKYPTWAYVSGVNKGKQTLIQDTDDNLKIISDIDALIEADRREITHPFRPQGNSYHEDL